MSRVRGTLLADATGTTMRAIDVSWGELVESFKTVDVHAKEYAPLLKLAGFGDKRTKRGSLRHDANVIEIYGLEGDYDAGHVTPEDAIERLERHNLRALVVTTHRHRPEAPRWRVYVPFGDAVRPQERAAYMAALNGALGGILAPESFRLSQSFYIGRPPEGEYRVLSTFGDPDEGYTLDELDPAEREALAVWPQDRSFVPQLEEAEIDELPTAGEGLPDLVADFLEHISPEEYWDWIRVGMALHFCDSEAGLAVWDQWSGQSDKYPGPQEIRARWESFSSERVGPNAGTLVRLAREGGYEGPSWSAREIRAQTEAIGVDLSRFNLHSAPGEGEIPMFAPLALLLDRPELLAPPAEIVPRLVWKGRTTGIIAPDKAGKSTLMGHAVAALTNGEAFLGQPVRAGTALIVAPDEAVGDTVRRLSEVGAHPQRTRLLTMHPDKLLPYVRREMSREAPDLLVVDSLAEWARLVEGRAPDDGDSAGWGAVVRPLVQLSRDFGVGIALLHHPRRSDGQYRGSGEIAAALDCLLEIQMPKAGEDETLRRFAGRARWPISPFELVLQDGRYMDAESIELPLRSRILIDLKVAGPSSRNQQHKRIKVRKATYLAAINSMLLEGQLFEKNDLLYHPDDHEDYAL